MANQGRNTKTEYRAEYQYESAVRKPAYERESERRQQRAPQAAPRRKAFVLPPLGNIVTFAIMVVSIVFFARVMINYVEMQGRLSNEINTVAAMRSDLNSLRSENDANYNRIVSGIDLSRIEEIAKNELGMTYAQEGQVILYSSESNDYMRKIGN